MIILQSECQSWSTPSYVFRPLRKEFELTQDVCATFLNAKLPDFIPPPWAFPEGPLTRAAMAQADGLSQSWQGHNNWLQPPYTNKGPYRQAKWLTKARDEAHAHNVLTVGLIPARTGARAWAQSIWSGAREVRFVQGRIVFQLVDWCGEWGVHRGQPVPLPRPAETKANATFDAAVIVWKGHHKGLPKVSTWKPERRAA